MCTFTLTPAPALGFGLGLASAVVTATRTIKSEASRVMSLVVQEQDVRVPLRFLSGLFRGLGCGFRSGLGRGALGRWLGDRVLGRRHLLLDRFDLVDGRLRRLFDRGFDWLFAL